VALQLAQQVENATIVFIVCDRGDRYLSTGVFPGMSERPRARTPLLPTCATPLAPAGARGRRRPKERLRCPACGWTHWNNPTPVLAAVIECADRAGSVLLARNAAWPGRMFALITGFMEAGETPEDGITREVAEETGAAGASLDLIGVYDFQRMNQVIIAYHVLARARSAVARTGRVQAVRARRRCAAGRPAPAMRWPTGCARAGTSRSSSICRRGRPEQGRIAPEDRHGRPRKRLDTRGLNCPLPILKAKKALADMKSGECCKVVSTDPGSVRDFQAFARQTGNELVEQTTAGDEFMHVLRPR
jgi:TusA-related sulfurtransferase/ADP-ribose pyrophosphatase YjhB (NUDIX family)